MKIGVIGLAEAGNLGDDLISIAVFQAIKAAAPHAHVKICGFGHPLDWDSIGRRLGTSSVPESVRPSRDLPGSRHDERLFADCDAIVFGGGGLLETTHHPNRPYHWLRFLPHTKPLVPTLAVGLGIGPLNARWQHRLRTLGCPFDAVYLRDDDSAALARRSLGWNVERCRDFVDAEFLDQFASPADRPVRNSGDNVLGVALRAWPGLDPASVAKHVDHVATEFSADMVRFYVLEAQSGASIDIPFSRSVMRRVTATSTSERLYSAAEVLDFIDDLARCSVAVSMKLHSSAIWAAAKVPMFPIIYAPKMAAFFDRPYRGLEMIEVAVEPAHDDPASPRSQAVVRQWLNGSIPMRMENGRARFGAIRAVWLQTSSFAVNVRRRLGPVARPTQRSLDAVKDPV